MPEVVFTLDELDKLGLSGNFLNNFCAAFLAQQCQLMKKYEFQILQVMIQIPHNLLLGTNDRDRYNLI